MDFDALEPNVETAHILTRILADFAADDPEQPWTDGEVRIAVPADQFPIPELALAALRWVGYVPQHWDDKTAWRLGGRFRDRNVALSSTKFGLRFMVESDASDVSHKWLDVDEVEVEQDADVDDVDKTNDVNQLGELGEVGDITEVDGATSVSNKVGGAPEWRDEVDELLLSMARRRRVPRRFSATRHNLSDGPDLKAFLDDFLADLSKAVRVFDKHVFSKLVKDQVSAGNVTLLNQSGRLRGAYGYFRWQAQALIDGHGDNDLRQQMAGMGFLAAGGKSGENFFMPFVADNQLGYCLTAMASAYFSWLEHVLVLALPFTDWEPEDRSITDVIGDKWSLKWSRVVPDTPESEEAFDRLKVAVEEFRNLDAHGGFGKKERALLIHTPVGVLPARLTEGADAVRATIIPDTPAGFPQACAVFDATDEFLRTGPLSAAMTWIEGGLQVPFNGDHRRMLKVAMSEVDEPFEETVNRYAQLEDRINNFELY